VHFHLRRDITIIDVLQEFGFKGGKMKGTGSMAGMGMGGGGGGRGGGGRGGGGGHYGGDRRGGYDDR
jgi:hypothetical protein